MWYLGGKLCGIWGVSYVVLGGKLCGWLFCSPVFMRVTEDDFS